MTFLADSGRSRNPVTTDLNTYPDLHTVTIPMTAWPPARTAPCWWLGRKYKQCCRRHGLGTLSDAAAAVRVAGAEWRSARDTPAERRPAAGSQPRLG